MSSCGAQKFGISPISTDRLEVGTRIHWDNKTGSFYFVDVAKSNVYKYHLESGEINKAKVGDEPLAFMFPVEGADDKFIAGLSNRFVYAYWDGKTPNICRVETIAEVDTEENLKGNRLNGAKVDPAGRLWAGTMGPSGSDGMTVPGRGSLYSLTKGVLKKHETNIGISNGLAWNLKENKMYYIDTLVPGVLQYDFDSKTGNICNRTQVFSFKDNNIKGLPDGLTIDSDGNLWVCAIFGSALVRFNPKCGTLLDTVTFPTSEITSATFGGPELDKLYVTTAMMPENGAVPADPAGRTFVVSNVGTKASIPDTRYIP